MLWGPQPHGLTGSKLEKICEMASIDLNRNAVLGEASALFPGGVRIGAPAMSTKTAEFLDRCCQIAAKVELEKGKKLKDFESRMDAGVLSG